ncbi:MAG: extracellular solute-binding protein [Trueperaceae bacterium]|nr:MAG: extracellular solute-binding protein [Trueperaceae bacterium]
MFLVLVLATGSAFGQGLTLWTTFGDQTLEWLEGEAASFTAAFGVPTNVVRLDLGELRQQALLAAPQGQAGDLFIGIPHDQIADFALGGVADDIASFATAAYLADLSEQARLAYTFNGRLIGLPMFVEGPALIVNNDLVDAVPATYEALIEKAQELTTADTFGFMYDVPNFYFSFGWINTFGGYVFGSDATGSLVAGDVGLDIEGAIAGAQAVKDLRFEHGLVPAGTNYDVANGLFVDGALAMIYNGPWAVSQYESAGLDVSVHPMPPLADGTPFSGFMGVQGVLMNPFSTMRADAANFAKWITRTDAQVTMAQFSGRIPASISALTQVADEPFIASFGQALLDSVPMPNIPQMSNVWGPMGDALSVILESEGSDVGATLERAAADIRGN